jgi:hypothetical protein
MQDLSGKISNGGATQSGKLSADEFNQVANEDKNLILASGQTLSGLDLNQKQKAIVAFATNGGFCIDSGSANAYVLEPLSGRQRVHELQDGMRFYCETANPNTTVVTANAHNTGNKAVVSLSGEALVGGEIVDRFEVQYDLSNDRFVLLDNAKIGAYAKLTEEYAGGISGGNFPSGSFVTRNINNVESDDDSIVSLSSKVFTLEAGNYLIRGHAQGYEVGAHKTRIRNTTSNTTAIVGDSAYTNPAYNQQVASSFSGKISLSSDASFELQHYCQTTDISGMGVDLSTVEEVAIYAVIEIIKVK